MKSTDFINKIKTYSVVSFLLPLLAINSCLLLYKFFGNIEAYPNFDWDKKVIEVAENSNDYNYSSYINCPKYKYKTYLLTLDNKLICDSGTSNIVSECHLNKIPVYLFLKSLKLSHFPASEQNIKKYENKEHKILFKYYQ